MYRPEQRQVPCHVLTRAGWISGTFHLPAKNALVDFIKHRVRSGETLSLIARRYRTSVANIMLANNLRRANYIVTGITLKIPQYIKPLLHGKMGS